MPTSAFQARPSGNLLTHRDSILLVLLPSFGRLYSLQGMSHADPGFYCRLWTAISSLDPCTTSTHCSYIYVKDASTHLDQTS